ncbi:hypothetical protein QR680_004739 [Steinernema hermaphroditum]|uniref:G-protein coupled receptors family 1 profile domain-containing protein n=1 Tax=Steinernema hermaphroditum TaxID=289476 RepID=A0AA39LUG9_9BILA|nr:hypothetical protein QR680_004739 [Steinernema hermaphroditum]
MTRKPFKNNICFVIMANLGVVQCFHSMTYLCAGIFLLADSTFAPIVECIPASVSAACLSTYYLHTALLAFNRFVVISDAIKLNRRVYHLLLALIWMFFLSHSAVKCSPFAWSVFYQDVGFFTVAPRFIFLWTPYPWTPYIRKITKHLTLISLITTGALYVLTVLFLAYKRKQLTSHQQLMSKAEFRILVQAFAIFLTCLWNFFGTTVIQNTFDMRSVEFAVWFYVSQLTLQWVNPVLYLVMNRDLRVVVRKIMKCGKNNAVMNSCQAQDYRTFGSGSAQMRFVLFGHHLLWFFPLCGDHRVSKVGKFPAIQL